MSKTLSPLRYPGGKTKIYDKVKRLIILNGFENRTYVEPFAGGFGIGINLLNENIVQNVVLNDFDSHIYNFWYSVLNYTEDLIRLIETTPISLDEREKQKKIFASPNDILSDGFATLFLNRVNYSGVIKGGPIGGYSQESSYKINCRFNKSEVVKKIQNISKFKERITLYNCDASDLITKHINEIKNLPFFNIDPPYVVKGSQLYTNYFVESDHRELMNIIKRHLDDIPWIITYDYCDLVRNIYKDYYMKEYDIRHSAGSNVNGKEVVITNIAKEKFEW